MSKKSKTKKSLLTIGTALLPSGISMIVNGSGIEGAILTALGAASVVGYDVLDDKTKEVLLSGLDADALKDGAEEAAETVDEATSKK